MTDDKTILNCLQAGIRAEAARQKAIASNVANLNTPGYRRFDVRFEEKLAEAIKSDSDNFDELEPEVYQPQNTTPAANGNDVSLDMEIGQMVKNTLKHKTYMLLLKKKYQQMAGAIGST